MFDEYLEKWFCENPGAETTVTECPVCGLDYKPSLGHKCKRAVKKAADTIHRVAVATVNENGFYADLVDAMSDIRDCAKAYDDGDAEFIRGAEAMLDYVRAYAKTKTELIREG